MQTSPLWSRATRAVRDTQNFVSGFIKVFAAEKEPYRTTNSLSSAPRTSMGKKRKAGGRPFGQTSEKENEPAMRTKYDINETFDESEDEFQAGRDQILLEEGPEAKRRRKLQEQGASLILQFY